MAFCTIDFTGVPQAKLDALATALNLTTESEVKAYMMRNLRKDVIDKLIYADRKTSEETHSTFTL